MRRPIPMLVAVGLAIAAPAAAGDGFSLRLADLPIGLAATADAAAEMPPTDLTLELADDRRDALVYRTALTATSAKEFRLALWNAPLGRLYLSRAEAEAMLGREGLVHGGRSLGLGMGTTALGDQSSSAVGFMASGGSWSELTLGEKFAAGAEASFLAAILYALVEFAD